MLRKITKDSLISIETYNITHPCALAGAKHCLRIRLNSCSALRARLSLHPSCDCACVTASTVVTISNIHPCRHIIPPCTPCHCFCPLSVWLPHCLAGSRDNRWRHSSCSWRETMVTVIPAYGGHCGAWHRHPGNWAQSVLHHGLPRISVQATHNIQYPCHEGRRPTGANDGARKSSADSFHVPDFH